MRGTYAALDGLQVLTGFPHAGPNSYNPFKFNFTFVFALYVRKVSSERFCKAAFKNNFGI